MSSSLDPELSIASVLDTHPMAARVFARHDIDFCCHGGRSIAEAASAAGVPVDRLLDEISAPGVPVVERPPASLPTPELIDHILVHHHRPLDDELPRLVGLADKVANAHGGRVHLAVREHVVALRDDLLAHMMKEERVLFPWILAEDPRARMPLAVMREEHDLVGNMLRSLKKLTNDYTPAPEACRSWRALWSGLQALTADLHQHIHLENNVLFERVTSA